MDRTLIYPNVTTIPSNPAKDKAQAPDPKGIVNSSSTESFNQILGSELTRPITEPLRFSAHAAARVQSRKLNVGEEQMRRLNEAVNKAAAKGLDDTLVLTKDSAFIVNVKNRTVVTAMDRSSMEGNVFTNIDGAVVI